MVKRFNGIKLGPRAYFFQLLFGGRGYGKNEREKETKSLLSVGKKKFFQIRNEIKRSGNNSIRDMIDISNSKKKK